MAYRRKTPSGVVRIMRDRQRAIQALQSHPYNYYGFYRGHVVEIMTVDHEEYREGMMGRVRVRVPAIHQSKDITPDNVLPWAEVGSMGGGLSDCGSYEPPYKGAKVLVLFEQGHPDYPLVVATWNAAPTKSKKVTVADEEVTSPGGVEAPLEALESATTRVIWRKTWKGHTIYCEEQAGAEFLRIIDRAGNTIELASPVSDPSKRRGSGNSIDGGSLTFSDIEGESHILLKDISGQEIKMTVGAVPEISITTTGVLKLGSKTASFGVTLARMLNTVLSPIIAAIQYHTHDVIKEGAPTGPATPAVPGLPDPSAWESPNVLGGLE